MKKQIEVFDYANDILKAVKTGVMQVDRGQGDIEPHPSNNQRDQQADEYTGQSSFCLAV